MMAQHRFDFMNKGTYYLLSFLLFLLLFFSLLSFNFKVLGQLTLYVETSKLPDLHIRHKTYSYSNNSIVFWTIWEIVMSRDIFSIHFVTMKQQWLLFK